MNKNLIALVLCLVFFLIPARAEFISLKGNNHAYLSAGLKEVDFQVSLKNLNTVIKLEKPKLLFSEVTAQNMLTPESKKPPTSSRVALETIMEMIINGNAMSSYWCERNKDAPSELISPTSFRISGDAGPDIYHYVDKAYVNSHNVIIESSNQGGSPITVAWGIRLMYSEPLAEPGSLKWCIERVR